MNARGVSSLGPRTSRQIHVWVVWLSPRLRLGPLLRGLSRNERKAARAFIDLQARTEFITSRVCVRVLASRYLGVSHRKVALAKTIKGQPQLIDPSSGRRHGLNVSLSHCIAGVAIAFGRKTRVGVDLESHLHPPALTIAVARLCTSEEGALVSGEIWDCWARREALLKGLGLGLSGLHSVPSLELENNFVRSGASTWTVNSISLSPDTSLACAAEGIARRFRVLSCRPSAIINKSF